MSHNIIELILYYYAAPSSMDVHNSNIIIIVVVSVVALFTLSLMIIVCICLSCKYNWSLKALSDDKTGPGDAQSSESTQPGPVYETVMECTIVDLDMIENVAYAPIHTLKKNTNTIWLNNVISIWRHPIVVYRYFVTVFLNHLSHHMTWSQSNYSFCCWFIILLIARVDKSWLWDCN